MSNIKLDGFKPRPYQQPIIDAFNKGYKRMILIMPRRSGKDVLCFNLLWRAALKTVGSYYYVFPTFSSGRRILWDQLTMDGRRILDYIPPDLVDSRNEATMRIRLKNGSYIQVIGSDNFDNTLVGTNPRGIIFSEYALQHPDGFQFALPILRANDGFAVFNSTPRGRNHFHDLYKIALANPDVWFSYKLTVDDTQHIDVSEIRSDIEKGSMSEDLAMQEYWTSFEMGATGSYYTTQLDRMRLNFQIEKIPWEPSLKVHTAWDIGVRDSTVILWFQNFGTTTRIIDYYEKSSEGLEHYVKVINSKPYIYGRHIAPHDIGVREFGSGMTRIEIAKKMGLNFTIAPDIPLMDGIEAVRAALAKVYIDEDKCRPLIKALENYRREYDSEKKVYKSQPLHDQYSHACFVGETLVETESGPMPIERIKAGMKVKTPFGYHSVLKTHSHLTQDLLEVKTNSGGFICTPHHDIFTQSGIKKSIALSYADILEYNSKITGWLWNKIYGYCGEAFATNGFKKSYLSLKTRTTSILMDILIGGMEFIIDRWGTSSERQAIFTGQCGNSIVDQSQKDGTFITSTVMGATMQLRTSSACLQPIITSYTTKTRTDGRNQINANNLSNHYKQKQSNGIDQKRAERGTKSMLSARFPCFRELSIQRSVQSAGRILSDLWSGLSFVVTNAKRVIGSNIDLISLIGLALFVELYLIVTSTLSKKHAVKSVELYPLNIPKEVYDLTIEKDNCYYANGYLVSNSDAMRYLCVSLPKTKDGLSVEELERRYQEAMSGTQSNLPNMFRDDFIRY